MNVAVVSMMPDNATISMTLDNQSQSFSLVRYHYTIFLTTKKSAVSYIITAIFVTRFREKLLMARLRQNLTKYFE